MFQIDDDDYPHASIDVPEFGTALTFSGENKVYGKVFCEKPRTNKEFESMIDLIEPSFSVTATTNLKKEPPSK